MNTQSTRPMSWRLARIGGIEIYGHASVIITFLLITISMTRLLADLYPHWHLARSAALACLAGLLFFASLIGHELAHSFVARMFDIKVERITVFLFGGVAEIAGEPQHPKDEFFIAAAGPLASLVFSLLFFSTAFLVAGTSDISLQPNVSPDSVANSGTATVLYWLAAVNLMLAIFNLLPGFPMDGGRLFRAALWWRTNDYLRATKQAAKVGQGIGLLIAGLGFLQILTGNTINGIWTLFIGWFIHFLAASSARQAVTQIALHDVDVRQLMRTHFERVPLKISTSEFIDQYLLRSKQQLWPVFHEDEDIGYVLAENFLGLDIQRPEALKNYLQPLESSPTLEDDTPAVTALSILTTQTSPIPVVRAGKIVGLLDHSDMVRWLALHRDITPAS